MISSLDKIDDAAGAHNDERADGRVLVVDFGAQYAQLIARRVRDLHVYSEIISYDMDDDGFAALKARPPKAIILSGGPASVYADDAPELDKRFLELGVPVLGFCYGMQAMAVALGGDVPHTGVGEYGPAELNRRVFSCGCPQQGVDPSLIDTQLDGRNQKCTPSALLGDTPMKQTVWMSHRDSVSQMPKGFVCTASTETTPVAAMECPSKKLYATQFHPEVSHTQYGMDMLGHFLFDIAGCTENWSMEGLADQLVAHLREQIGDKRVILGLSGGVDSSVVAALLSRAIGKKLTCVFVDHGMLRKDEGAQVQEVFTKQFDTDFVYVHAGERMLKRLDGVSDPEQKRHIIGESFWRFFFGEAQKLEERTGEKITYLAQGTIYPDTIESGSAKASKSGKASTIKSHHNLIPFPEGIHFDLIEPLRKLFKDEVRRLGLALGLPDYLVWRQPFPGPGLAVRIIGTITAEKLDMLREADAIVRQEIDAYNEQVARETGVRDSEHSAWQYFAVLPDIRSVGVMGDERTYAHPIIVRAVESEDAMTADWAKFNGSTEPGFDFASVMSRISTRIVAEVDGVNRVAYDITSKPPGTIEWE
ncbi:MAG: glutamine-hydrolyzing GMP synthase [Coriobacteriales bacterium]|jgi:GMP synthase (glutamine-hydrolysing)|nr:glutamine-hydrolyzing GMP synthase [Coriobacteriales bacterium]